MAVDEVRDGHRFVLGVVVIPTDASQWMLHAIYQSIPWDDRVPHGVREREIPAVCYTTTKLVCEPRPNCGADR